MSNYKPHPHAELMQQWADDHKTIPPRHQWEFCGKNEYDKKWVLLSLAPAWSRSIDYRRVAKSIPNPNAERIMQWAEDNQTIPPTHKWECMHPKYTLGEWKMFTNMGTDPDDIWLYRRTPA